MKCTMYGLIGARVAPKSLVFACSDDMCNMLYILYINYIKVVYI